MENFNEPHSSENEPIPSKDTLGDNYGPAIGKSFFILIVQVFLMPIKVLKTAVTQVVNSDKSSENTEFVVLTWFKNICDASIVLCYPLGLLGIIITALDMTYGAGEFFIGACIGLYFFPILLGLYKEFIAIMIVAVKKLEEIARNTRK